MKGDYSRFEEIRVLLTQMAKLTVDAGLPGTDGYQSARSPHYADGTQEPYG